MRRSRPGCRNARIRLRRGAAAHRACHAIGKIPGDSCRRDAGHGAQIAARGPAARNPRSADPPAGPDPFARAGNVGRVHAGDHAAGRAPAVDQRSAAAESQRGRPGCLDRSSAERPADRDAWPCGGAPHAQADGSGGITATPRTGDQSPRGTADDRHGVAVARRERRRCQRRRFRDRSRRGGRHCRRRGRRCRWRSGRRRCRQRCRQRSHRD